MLQLDLRRRFKVIALCLLLAGVGSSFAQAQSGNPFLPAKRGGLVRVESSLRTDPSFSPISGMYVGSSRHRGITNGPTFYTRILVNQKNQTYLGYELLLEQQESGKYLATFGRLGVTPLDLAAGSIPSRAAQTSSDSTKFNPIAWNMLPLPALPEPRLIDEGDTLSIVLSSDTADGSKLIDDIKIDLMRPANSTRTIPQIPTVAGPPRDFQVGDAELTVIQPRIVLDRVPQSAWGPGLRNVHGPIVWLYLPDHGRFLLSLLPRATLGFKKAGEVRGGVLEFSHSDHSIKLECMNPIATGHAAYNLYVRHDPEWEPTAESQKHLPAFGTVSAAELAVLR